MAESTRNIRSSMDLGTFRNITVTRQRSGLFQARSRIRLRTGHVRHMARTGGTELEARNLLFRALQDELAKGPVSRVSGDTLFREIAERFLRNVERTKSNSTHYMYRHHMQESILPAIGDLALNEVTVVVLEDLFDELANRYAPASLRNIRAPLSGAMGIAVRLEAIPSNPVQKMARIEGKTARARAMSETEIARLLDLARSDKVARRYDLPDFIEVMLGTGCRIGEALALRWSHVDLMERRIDVEHNIVALGKLEVHDGKTDAARRRLFMSDDVFEVLLSRSTDRDLGPDSPVFASSVGGYRSPTNVRRAMRRLYAQDPVFSWVKQPTHVFRKTCATRMRQGGVADLEIADFLGHEDVSTTQKSYVDRSLPSRGAAAALNGITRSPSSDQVG